jgi:MFS family permease
MNENSTPQEIIRNYLVIAAVYTLSASIIWGVNTLFLLNAGLDILEVFIANGAFTLGMVLFEIPTGVLADARGRRASFLLSLIVLYIGTLAYLAVSAFGGDLTLFVIASIFLGLGYTFYSGAMEAWLVDALNSTGFEGQLDGVFARSSMITGVAMLVGTIGGGFIGSLDLSYPYLIRAVLLAITFGFAFVVMRDIGFKPHKITLSNLPKEMGKIASASIQFGWNQQPIKLLMLCGFVQMGFFAWAFYASQPYFLELLGQNLIWVIGIITALFSLSTIIGNAFVGWATKFCGKRSTLLIGAAVIQTIAMVLVGLAGNFWLAVAFFLIGTTTLGVIGPVKQAFMHQIIPSEQRATVISFDSMVGNGGGVLGQGSLGYLSQVRSLAEGYVFGGIFTILALPLLFLLRRLKTPADIIVGAAGKSGPCPQGLPEVTGIDATPHHSTEEVV